MLDKGIYGRWSHPDAGIKFSRRNSWDKLFQSERHFLKKISGHYKSVLDVGCALGGLAAVFDQLAPGVEYLGVDISRTMIDQARTHYDQYKFVCSNILEFDTEKTYNLVFSTGVCQHEPRFKDVIRKLAGLSDRYVLFDCKLVSEVPSIIDINQSYCDYENRLYYILVNVVELVECLQEIPGVNRIDIYGYFTTAVASAVFPAMIQRDRICACHVLLEKGDAQGAPVLHIDLPDEMMKAVNVRTRSAMDIYL